MPPAQNTIGIPFHGAGEARIDIGLALGQQTEFQR